MKYWLFIISTIILSACSRNDRQAVDKLNEQSYAYHYRNIDSTESYARRAAELAEGYHAGRAEALNNLAFVHIVRMEYDEAERLLNEVVETTNHQVQQLIAYVQQMRLCQRRSRNREFHDYRELADKTIRRINEERASLSEHDQRCLLYAETEYAIVNSTYYYYVGLEQQSIDALNAINPNEVQRDTAQFLNYLYNIGAGGIITEGTQQEINQQEFDRLMRCFLMARQGDYPYFAANALEALSEHLMEPPVRDHLMMDNMPAMKFLNPDRVDDNMLAGYLAENSLYIFREFGDVYQIAGAYRTLASCFRQIGDYESALYNLEQALSDSAIYQAPDLVASIREQLSVAYAAIDDKQQSDYNRNLYLDVQETTRQDRQLEARANQYERALSQLNIMILAVIVAIILLLFSLWLFNHLNKKRSKTEGTDELLEQKTEEINALQLRVEASERRNLEQRAKVSLVNNITPFIDRILHEVKDPKKADPVYIRELTDQINDYNDVLTYWIQLRQGELSLHIESFALQDLFDLLAKGHASFQMKGVELNIAPTDTVVKADKVLTLFMLNTLADNARKFTDKGGRVSLSAKEEGDYVEIAVEDTGKGMTEEQLQHLFEAKPIKDDGKAQTSHGFGLLNCKGIIEKYRKISQIFSVCQIAATSKLGQGSRLFFLLPKGILRLLILGMLLTNSALFGYGQQPKSTPVTSDPLAQASAYADSAYFCNINGLYERTLLFADSCIECLNRHYLSLQPRGRYLMRPMGNPSLMAPEIKWLHDGLDVNFHIILDIRNESAVAALALHEWQIYSYNNRIYTQLFKEMSADDTLGDYCRTMQQSQTNKTIAIILLVILALAILPAYYLLYYRHRLYSRFLSEQQRQTDLEMLDDEQRRTELEISNLHVSNAVLDNCLSTLKHETMYYPSRIRQILDSGDTESLSEVTSYYRELYGLLSQQAMRQVDRAHLHLRPIQKEGVSILGDENLIRYLLEILRKQSGVKKPEMAFKQKNEQYVEVSVTMPGLDLSKEQPEDLFVPTREHIPFLICRQIVRDHGEATNRRGCGIRAENVNGCPTIFITLPSAAINNKTK
jgi:signal transduction histidine kinase